MSDPRTSIIGRRLHNIKNIIAVTSGKGGVGKSVVASILALTLTEKGCKTGFLDLDFTSPSTHVILGVRDLQPEEERGIIPPNVHGMKYMSLTYYVGDRVSPLRGIDVTNALIELLSVTIWGELDFLILDMPPGIGDAILDLLRLVDNAKFLIITTSSKVAFETVRKLLGLLSELNSSVIGVVENMKVKGSQYIRNEIAGRGMPFWGEIPFDPELEKAIGDEQKLRKTHFRKSLVKIIEKNLFLGNI